MANNSNELSVKITAEIDQLKKELTKANKEIADFGNKAEKSAKKTEDISKSADKNSKSLKGLSRGLEDTVGGVEDLTRSSGDLSDKLRGVGKIATGTTSSLAGVGGAALFAVGGILAVAAAIGTALYFYGKHRAEAFDLELQYKRLNDRVKEYEKSLWGVSKVQLKGTQGAARNLAILQSLRAQIDNTTLSHEDRTKAIDALRKKYPSYFKDLSDEKILLGEVGKSYNSLTEDILKNARAKAGLEALTANLKKQFALEKQLLDKSLEISENIYLKKTLQGLDYANKVGGPVGATGQKIINLEEEELKLLEDHEAIGKDIIDVQKESARIAKIISDNGGIMPFGGPGESADDVLKKAKEAAGFFANFGASQTFSRQRQETPDGGDFFGNEDVTKSFQGIGSTLEDETANWVGNINTASQSFKAMGNDLLDMNDDFPEWLSIPRVDPNTLAEDGEILKQGLTDMEITMQNFAQDFENLVAGTIAQTAIDLGESIGEALASGESVVGAIGSSLLASFGRFLGDMGELLIAYGALAIAKGILDNVIATGGYQAIIAGAAAIVVGIALIAVSSAMGSKASGGAGASSGSGSSAGAGSYSGSSGSSRSRASSGGSGGGGTYVFEIQGTKLVGVISNTLKRNNALGGGLTISTTPTG